MSDKCKSCGHERRYHANPERHVLGTSHCTKVFMKGQGACDCRHFVESEE